MAIMVVRKMSTPGQSSWKSREAEVLKSKEASLADICRRIDIMNVAF
jgi:hypothetical protein